MRFSPLRFFVNKESSRRVQPAAGTLQPEDPARALDAATDAATRSVGQYLTDGVGLFRVVHAIRDAYGRTLLLELEDCRTLQLMLCDPETVSRRTMERVIR